jgi:ABC-2 type transport system permease protein
VTLTIAGFELRRRRRGLTIVAVLIGVTVFLLLGTYPSLEAADVDWDAILESFPEELRTAFVGSVDDISTIEGYLVSQFYQLVWVALIGGYAAYTAGSAVAGEVEGRSIDVVLTRPLSRTQFVVEKFLALVVGLTAVNVVTLVAVLLGVGLLGERIDLGNLLVTHAVTGVYLTTCAAIGLVASVLLARPRRAQSAALGAVLGSYLLDTLTLDSDAEWLGALSPSRYLDVGDLLVRGDVDFLGVALLVVATCLLVVLAAELFERRDVPN